MDHLKTGSLSVVLATTSPLKYTIVILFLLIISEMSYPDPVYPFGSQHVVPMPPFMEPGNGLEVNGLKLGVNIADPITPNFTGALTLKLGAGLSLNANGALTSNSFAKTQPPLSINSSDELILNIGTGLQVSSSGELEAVGGLTSLSATAPLQLNNDVISLLYSGGLKRTGNSLELNIEAPFQISNGMLSIKLGNGLILQGGLLTPNVAAPLIVSNNALGLNFGSGLQLVNGVLTATGGGTGPPPTTYTFQPPLVDQNGVISLDLQNPITLTGGSLGLQLSPQLGVNASGELTPLYTFSSPLTTQSDGTTVGLGLDPPFKTGGGNLQLDMGAGLLVDGGKLATSVVAPLTYNADAIALNISDDFSLNSQGALRSTFAFLTPLVANQYASGSRLVTLTYTAPFYNDSNLGLSLKIGNGLSLVGDTLVANTGSTVTTKNPLEMINSVIGLKYAPGLSITPYGHLKCDTTPNITTMYNAGTSWLFTWYKYDIMYVLSVAQANPKTGDQTLTFSNAPQDFYQFLIDADTGPSGNGWVSPLGATQTYGGHITIFRYSDMYRTFKMSLTTNDHFGNNTITSWTAVKYGSLNP